MLDVRVRCTLVLLLRIEITTVMAFQWNAAGTFVECYSALFSGGDTRGAPSHPQLISNMQMQVLGSSSYWEHFIEQLLLCLLVLVTVMPKGSKHCSRRVW